jgi:hypothetical protein
MLLHIVKLGMPEGVLDEREMEVYGARALTKHVSRMSSVGLKYFETNSRKKQGV